MIIFGRKSISKEDSRKSILSEYRTMGFFGTISIKYIYMITYITYRYHVCYDIYTTHGIIYSIVSYHITS